MLKAELNKRRLISIWTRKIEIRKDPKTEEGAERVGSARIQKNKLNKDNGDSQNQQTRHDIQDVTLKKTRWQRFSQFLDKRTIVLITLFYTVFAGLQWCSIKKSNFISQEALVSVQRAYVNFKTIESIGIRDAKGRITAWHFFPQWENSGTTPTKIMRQHSNAGARETLPRDFDFQDVDPNNNRNILLSPKATISTGPLIIRPEVIAGVKEGRLHLFFWGWAAYRDIFKNSKAHLTEFCTELTISVYGDVTTGKGVRFLYVSCPSHNCADEDCKDYAETEKRLEER